MGRWNLPPHGRACMCDFFPTDVVGIETYIFICMFIYMFICMKLWVVTGHHQILSISSLDY